MAVCDEGYVCDVCGQEVEAIVDSDLYLRYILGEVHPMHLANTPERHIRCNPAIAQYIVDPAFTPPIVCEGPFAKAAFDEEFVRDEEQRITRGWRRLQEAATQGLAIPEYPLPEVRERWGLPTG
ncbi:MAG: hypothetical protein K2X38_10585 [Gemmataceae bacterium]|nr:hypothetical protein [Gemmataceae bacterium]